jgi:hypothetical protein
VLPPPPGHAVAGVQPDLREQRRALLARDQRARLRIRGDGGGDVLVGHFDLRGQPVQHRVVEQLPPGPRSSVSAGAAGTQAPRPSLKATGVSTAGTS